MINTITLLGFVPLMVVFAFSVQWAGISGIHSSAERLPLCRDAYIGYSFLLVVFAWVLYFMYGSGARFAFMLPLGASFALAGDYYNLEFEGARHSVHGESIFGGVIFFVLVQLCFSAGFLARVSPDALISLGFFIPLLALFLVIPSLLFAFRVYSAKRPRRIMITSFAYGLLLGTMSAIAISSAIVYGGFWWFVATGAFFYLVSDAVLGMTTIHGWHPIAEFQIPWFTYLIGQGLILYGYALILR